MTKSLQSLLFAGLLGVLLPQYSWSQTAGGGTGNGTGTGTGTGTGGGGGGGAAQRPGSSTIAGQQLAPGSDFAPGMAIQQQPLPTGAGTGTGGTNLVIPSTQNPFRGFYGNPQGMGLPTGTAATQGGANRTNRTVGFGQPLYAAAVNNLTGQRTTGTALANAGNAGLGFNTLNLPKGPFYQTTLSEDLPLILHSPPILRQNLQSVIRQSAAIPSREKVQVHIQDGVVHLHGQAASERERKLIERMIRLEPGVRAVENRLVVAETK